MSGIEEDQCRRCGGPISRSARFCPRCGTRRSQYVDPTAHSLASGWYPDPFAAGGYRYFNGTIWTGDIYTDRPGFSVAPIRFQTHRAPEGEWPASFGSLAFTLVGLALAFGLSFLFILPLLLAGRPGGGVLLLTVSELGLWSGLFATCYFESRRFGTGSIRQDFRVRFKGIDMAIGIGASLVARAISVAVLIPFIHVLVNPDKNLDDAAKSSFGSWAVLAVIICVGAPLFEELFFRGLLQGQLVERYGAGIGIAVTSVVFGAVHFANDPGVGGALLALSVGSSGVVLGIVRHATGRLGTSMVTHACFNLLPVIVLASEVGH